MKGNCILPAVLLGFGLFTAACGGHHGGGDDAGGDDSGDGHVCQGLECSQVDCPGGGTTSVSGTVYAPNGTLPLYNVTVYVPNGEIAPFPEGVTCDQCGQTLSGNPLVKTITDEAGHFELDDMPATDNVPLVIQVGKWRREITIPTVPQCSDTALAMGDTRFPRTQNEGGPNDNIPLMALSTGGADALECLLRKIGIADSEFTAPGGAGRVQLFAGVGGTAAFDATNGGASFGDPQASLWDSETDLSAYDVVLLSCEGGQNPGTKGATALQAMKDYADEGGKVFASHWHNYWIENGPSPWPSTITYDNSLADLNDITADVNQGFEKGAALAQWLVNVNASTTLGKIDITAAQHTITGVDETIADKWIHLDQNANGVPSVNYLSYTTPLESAPADRCGRVVFSDIHVASGDDSDSSLAFPSGGCTSDVATMSPQEKVLAFMIFDIASCVGPIVN
jgi:hypothetical protein